MTGPAQPGAGKPSSGRHSGEQDSSGRPDRGVSGGWTHWRRPIAIVSLVVAVCWAAWSIAGQRDEVAAALSRVDGWQLAGSFVCTAIGVICTALGWRCWAATLGTRLPVTAAARLFFVTQAGKYVPGAVWPFLAQAAAGRRFGVPAMTFPLTTALFLYSNVITGSIVSGVCLALSGGPMWLALPLLLAVVGLWPGTLRLLFSLLARIRPAWRVTLGHGDWKGHLLLFAAWAWYGVGLFLLAQGLAGGAVSVVRSSGAFALAWVVGLLVIFAPAGVGPREAVLVALLRGQASHADAIALALLSRVLMTLADVLLALVAAALIKGPGTADEQPPTG